MGYNPRQPRRPLPRVADGVKDRRQIMRISILRGKTLTDVRLGPNKQSILFTCENGNTYLMHHYQDCCEEVFVHDIAGELSDLIGAPLLMAEMVHSKSKTPGGREKPNTDETFAWTFYKFATIKGYVTICWYGSTSSSYSIKVEFESIWKGSKANG